MILSGKRHYPARGSDLIFFDNQLVSKIWVSPKEELELAACSWCLRSFTSKLVMYLNISASSGPPIMGDNWGWFREGSDPEARDILNDVVPPPPGSVDASARIYALVVERPGQPERSQCPVPAMALQGSCEIHTQLDAPPPPPLCSPITSISSPTGLSSTSIPCSTLLLRSFLPHHLLIHCDREDRALFVFTFSFRPPPSSQTPTSPRHKFLKALSSDLAPASG